MVKYSKFKLWAHQAIYGKIESMHTRLELIRVIDEQKRFLKAMESTLQSKGQAIMDLNETLKSEVLRTERQLNAINAGKEEIMRKDMAIHNLEQDNIRLQSILDSISLIHPGTIRQLKRIEKSRQFKDRAFTELARLGVNRKHEARQRIIDQGSRTKALPPLLLPLGKNSISSWNGPQTARPLGRYEGDPDEDLTHAFGGASDAFLRRKKVAGKQSNKVLNTASNPKKSGGRTSITKLHGIYRPSSVEEARIVLRSKWIKDQLAKVYLYVIFAVVTLYPYCGYFYDSSQF